MNISTVVHLVVSILRFYKTKNERQMREKYLMNGSWNTFSHFQIKNLSHKILPLDSYGIVPTSITKR